MPEHTVDKCHQDVEASRSMWGRFGREAELYGVRLGESQRDFTKGVTWTRVF